MIITMFTDKFIFRFRENICYTLVSGRTVAFILSIFSHNKLF